jgi:hypothetical protein
MNTPGPATNCQQIDWTKHADTSDHKIIKKATEGTEVHGVLLEAVSKLCVGESGRGIG